MHCGGQFFGARAKLRRKRDLLPTTWIAVEDRSKRNSSREHLLQAKRLRAELHSIAVVRLALASLVLNRKWLWTKLDDVGAPGQAEPLRPQPHAAHSSQVATPALSRQVGALVQQTSLGGSHVLNPDLFQVNQRPLPRTKGQVLQATER